MKDLRKAIKLIETGITMLKQDVPHVSPVSAFVLQEEIKKREERVRNLRQQLMEQEGEVK